MCKGLINLWKHKRLPCLSSTLLRLKVFSKHNASDEKRFFSSENSLTPVHLSYSTFHPEQAGSEIPIVILHGLLGSKQNWRGLAKAIAVKSKRKIYTLDARNHGESPHTDDFDYPSMAEDVKLFLSSRAISESVVIGHSMGGRAAMYLALINPNLVNKLIIVDVSPFNMPQTSSLSLNYMRNMKEAIKNFQNSGIVQGRKLIDEYLSQTIPEIPVRQFLLTNLSEKNKILEWKPNLEVLLEKFNAGIISFPSVNTHYQGEALFICGGESPFVRTEDHPYIKELFPKAEFITIPGAGHWVHSDKPTEFLQVVHEFL